MYSSHVLIQLVRCYLLAAFCALADPWESFLIGSVGALVSLSGCALLDKLKIDDPVGKS